MSERPRQSPALKALVARLFWLQTRAPGWVLLAALLSVLAAGLSASKLGLKTALGELLPENKESVIVAEQVNARLPAISTMSVVIEGSQNEGIKRFIDALAPELRAIGPEWVGVVDEGVQRTQAFFEDHKLLYAPLDLVEQIHGDIQDRYEYEVAQKVGNWLDDDYVPLPLTEESIRKRIDARMKGDGGGKVRFPDGYYLDEDKHVGVILVRTPIGSGDLDGARGLQQRVRQAVAKVDPKRFDPAIKIGLGGNLISSAETYAQIKNDLAHVGIWGLALIVGVVFLYYLRVRTLVAMMLTVGIGAAWTFGLAYLMVGHLNSSTGFLFSIVVGNGINFGIIYMARYLEARRDHEPFESVAIAHRETWLSTLTASAAATAAYGSLAVTDFRGFKHFGLIGGSGMLLCWAATYLFLPAMLVMSERLRPIKPPTGLVARLRGLYGLPFAFLATRFPRAVALAALVLTAASGGLAYRYLAGDPMEYNMRNIDNEPVTVISEATRVGRIVDPIVGRQGQDGIALATDRLEQVLPLKEALERRRDAAPADRKPFSRIVTIHDLLPKQQDEKIELLAGVRRVLARARRKGFIDEAQWQKVRELIGEEEAQTIGIEQLPEQVARPFAEKDGSRGKLIYIVPADGRSVWDARYLIDWADSIRRTELADGSVVKGSGRSVIFADMIQAVVEDAPRAIIVSLLSTLFIVLLAFRGRSAGWWVIAGVLAGLTWTLALLMVFNTEWPWQEAGKLQILPLKLNFLNFVALPITIGVGADYGVNVMQRYRLSGGNMRRAVVETGGAVVLCSLTTMLGYLALALSVNRAIQSFGVVAAAGEIACVVTGVLVLPACLVWLNRRKGGDSAGGPLAAAGQEHAA